MYERFIILVVLKYLYVSGTRFLNIRAISIANNKIVTQIKKIIRDVDQKTPDKKEDRRIKYQNWQKRCTRWKQSSQGRWTLGDGDH